MTSFVRGQKVTMIHNNGSWVSEYGEIVPQFGVVYTIRDIFEGDGRVYLRFAEIVNAAFEYLDGFMECAFKARRFRPVVERKTSIECFTRLLKNAPVRVTEDA